MSNEYRDWERDKIEEEKQIVAKYPFLRLRDIDGTVDTESKFPLMSLEIPVGWDKLFFQMCDDIKPLLEKEGVMDDFYFIQVKEKYNELVCYSNGIASSEVEQILQKYRYLARFICTECGKPAMCETTGYLASYCEGCWKDLVRHRVVNRLEFISKYEVVGFKDGKSYSRTVDVEDEWNRYLKENGYEKS
jgi:hypothetical protein